MSKEITREIVLEWLVDLRKHWRSKDVDKALSLFAHCTEYQESPFREVASSTDDIRTFWSEILAQRDIEVTYDLISVCDRIAAVSYEASYTDNDGCHQSSGIYILKFDHNANCVSFRQWFMVRSGEPGASKRTT